MIENFLISFYIKFNFKTTEIMTKKKTTAKVLEPMMTLEERKLFSRIFELIFENLRWDGVIKEYYNNAVIRFNEHEKSLIEDTLHKLDKVSSDTDDIQIVSYTFDKIVNKCRKVIDGTYYFDYLSSYTEQEKLIMENLIKKLNVTVSKK